MKSLYLCNPKKNPNCTKESCYINNAGPCSSTTEPQFAFLDEKGNPVKDVYTNKEIKLKEAVRLLKLTVRQMAEVGKVCTNNCINSKDCPLEECGKFTFHNEIMELIKEIEEEKE